MEEVEKHDARSAWPLFAAGPLFSLFSSAARGLPAPAAAAGNAAAVVD